MTTFLSAARQRPAARPSGFPHQGPLAAAFAAHGIPMTLARGEEIFAEEEAADWVYWLVSGVVRSSRVTEDGRRQVAAFHFAGDVFGIEPGAVHVLAAEAIASGEVLAVRRARLEEEAARDPALAAAFAAAVLAELGRAQAHLLLIGHRNAAERIFGFLEELAARLGNPACVELPMGRQDIGDYLGLTIETVSRMLTQAEDAGSIRMEGTRRIHLRPSYRLAA